MGKRLSFAEIGALSDQAAKGLQALGVGEGVKVGLLMPNSPTFVVFYHAILKAGGTVVNFNPLYSHEEIELQVRDSGTKIMVTLDLAATFDKVEALLASGALDKAVVASFASLLPKLKAIGHEAQPRAEARPIGLAAEGQDRAPSRTCSPMTAATGGRPSARTRSPCCNIPAAPRERPRAPCSPTPISPSM